MKRLLGLLGWLGVVLVLAAVALRFIKPELPMVYRTLALAGLGVTVLYALSQWRDIARSFQGRARSQRTSTIAEKSSAPWPRPRATLKASRAAAPTGIGTLAAL